MDKGVIQICDVSHVYTGSRPVRALEHVSLDVAKGTIMSIVGQSGCGKTTLLKIVAGLIEASSGRVVMAGLSAGEARSGRKFGMVFQNPVLFPWRTVRQNILLPFELRSGQKNASSSNTIDVEERARECAELVGLGEFWTALPRHLSGGMQARVAIARALSYKPEVLLMDEPFGSLDEITRSNLNEHLLSLHLRTKLTVLFVTHSIREAVFLSHQVCVLTPRPGQVQTILDVPKVENRIVWRETGEFSRFCLRVREALGE